MKATGLNPGIILDCYNHWTTDGNISYPEPTEVFIKQTEIHDADNAHLYSGAFDVLYVLESSSVPY